jgi:hypothetical protein
MIAGTSTSCSYAGYTGSDFSEQRLSLITCKWSCLVGHSSISVVGSRYESDRLLSFDRGRYALLLDLGALKELLYFNPH